MNSNGSKAILVEGARRIGKSTICEKFARNEYENYILIDFAKKDSMYPLDFEEFMWALGEDLLVDCIKACFENKIPMERGLHNKAMLLFKQYMLVGGMPKPVILFIENNKEKRFWGLQIL